MARAKKPKSKHKPRQDFFETLPMAVTPPAALPQFEEHIRTNLAAISRVWTHLLIRIRNLQVPNIEGIRRFGRVDWRRITDRQRITTVSRQYFHQSTDVTREIGSEFMNWGLGLTNWLLSSATALSLASRFAAATVADYTPPIASDTLATLRRLRRTIFSKRARGIYLAIAAGGTLAMVAAVAISATKVLSAYADDISSPATILAKKKTGTTILDRNGQVLFEGYGGQDTKVVPLSDIPSSLKNATLAAEDPEFYDHQGFSVKGIARAAWVDFTHHGTMEGGSTLTQQLVKNALLTSNQTFQRKYQELLLSVVLENRYSKDQILDMYLNEIYYGQGSSGVEAASQTYFHKPARDLTLSESALLAGLPLGPSHFDPNVSVEDATGRRDYVLTRMQELGKITKAEADTAKVQRIELAAAGAPKTGAADPMTVYSKSVQVKAPWFVFYVLDQLRQQYGDDMVEQGGITVKTTLDLNKQNIAQNAVTTHINALADHHVTNGGLVSLDPTNGDILAMVGSTDYDAPGFGNVNVTLSDLQPGSSFKPIAYATAFKRGWNGATSVDDAPISFPDGTGNYTPQNYDGKFHGTVTLRHALDNSLNIPAIKVLQYATIPDTLQTAHDMGITSLNDPSRYGLSLVLGGGEVRPIDMATVYATFANLGQKVEPRAILSVTDRHGKDVTKPTNSKPAQELDPRIAYMLTNIMSDNQARMPEFPLNGPLQLDRPAAAKTGTTNDFRDNWTIGYTPQLVAAVWVGNNDHTPMQNVDGITGAAPIWHDYMEGALQGQPALAFAQPPGVSIAQTCTNGQASQEVFLGTAPPPQNCAPIPVANAFQFLNDSKKNDIQGQNSDSPSDTPSEPTPDPNAYVPGSGGGVPVGRPPVFGPPEDPNSQ
jgi:1A family penicillin-binding protein